MYPEETLTKRLEQPSAAKLAEINERLEGASPQEILLWAHEEVGNNVALMSSFGLEDMALLDMFWRITQDARVMTLDTLRLPTETYTLFDQASARYGIKIEAFYPDMDEVRTMVEERGYNLFYKGIDNRKMCCGVRKVEPLGRALNSVNGWITGLRRDQGMERGCIDIVEWDAAHHSYKISPLADWTFEQVQEYIAEFSVPYNELHDKGFPSLGCQPCTRAVEPGEDIRAGRWWWESDPNAKECGLHLVVPATK
jgi:phosphoadenosine phosphosulfate reductase